MVTGTQGCPGLSGLASCPEAALVTLDTRAGGGMGTGDSMFRAATCQCYGRFLKPASMTSRMGGRGAPPEQADSG